MPSKKKYGTDFNETYCFIFIYIHTYIYRNIFIIYSYLLFHIDSHSWNYDSNRLFIIISYLTFWYVIGSIKEKCFSPHIQFQLSAFFYLIKKWKFFFLQFKSRVFFVWYICNDIWFWMFSVIKKIEAEKVKLFFFLKFGLKFSEIGLWS